MYNKLFAKIVDSSIWLEPDQTRIVWFMFIALMNEDGFVQFASIANVAHRARISKPKATEALKILESPDPNSSDDDNDGRRIERVPGGWIVLNAHKYRDLVTREMIREQTRQRVARKRAKDKQNVTQCNADVTGSNGQVTQSDTDTEIQSEKNKRKAPLDCILAYATEIGISNSDAQAFFDSMEAGGWTRNGKALKDWKAHLRSYKAQGWLASQRRKSSARQMSDRQHEDKIEAQMREAYGPRN